MKKILVTVFCILLLSGCGDPHKGAEKVVENYIDKYVNHDKDIIEQLNDRANEQELSENQKEIYIDIMKRQYGDLKYEFLSEEYDGDDATITLKITVYDLYKVQKEAEEFLLSNKEEFYDENDVYDKTIFLGYKLDKMQKTEERVQYTIDIFVTKSNSEWQVVQPSKTVLEKIHGIYNYDNK